MQCILKTTLTIAMLLLSFNATLHAQWEEDPEPPDVPDMPAGGSTNNVLLSTSEGTTVTTNETAITPELSALARSLKHDPALIYEYVKNRIDYLPIFSLNMGAHGCYVAQKGTEYDINALLIALLRESGYTCRYGYGAVRYARSDLREWISTKDSWMDNYLRRWGGYSGDVTGESSNVYAYRLWTEVKIDDDWCRLDPCMKRYRRDKIDIASAMNHSATNLRNTALQGATTGTADVGDLNRSGLRDALDTYTTNLLSYLETHLPNSGVDEIFGLPRIVPETITSLSTNLPVAYWIDPLTAESFDHLAESNMSTFRVRIGTIDHTFDAYELADQALTLTFDAQNAPVLSLGGETVTSGSALSSGNNDLQLDVHVARDPQWADQTRYDRSRTCSVHTDGAYSLMHAFNSSGAGNVRAAARRLADAVDSGDEREKELATLELMNMSYVHQRDRNSEIIGPIWNVTQFRLYKFGVVGTEDSMVVDLPGGRSATQAHTNGIVTADPTKTASLMASMLEQGVIEQYQQVDSVSTVGLLDLNIDDGGRTFLATTSTWSYVKSQIETNYSASLITQIDTDLQSTNAVYVLPESDELTRNDWTGVGYVRMLNTSMSMTISGGLSGGYGTVLASLDEELGLYLAALGSGNTSGTIDTTGADPVSLTSGAYLLDRDDLILANGKAPRGLSFSRHYRSTGNRNTGVLGHGWRHSYQGSARETTRPGLGWGERTPADVVAQVVQHTVIKDLLEGDRDATDWAMAAVVTKWAMDQLTQNCVTIEIGNRVWDFTRQPDGSYSAPPGVTESLILTNNAYRLVERFGTEYRFNTNGLLTSIVDNDANALSLTYDSATNLTTVTDSYSRALTFNYDSGFLTNVTDGTGRSISFGYSATNLTSFTDAEGHEWSYGYDGENRMDSMTDPLSTVILSNVYNAVGHVVTQYNGAASEWVFYCGDYRGAEVDPLAGETAHWFDRDGRNLGTQDAVSNRTYRFYDAQGHVVSNIDGRGQVTVLQWDGNHNTTCRIDKAGNPWKQEFDEQHRLVKAIDPLGNITRFGYDANHHLTNTVDALSNSIARTYYTTGNDKGLLHTVTDPNDNLTTYTYTSGSYGMPETITRTDGGTVTNTWNERGDLLVSKDALGNPTTRTYDKRRLLISVTDALSNSVSNQYNVVGLRTKVLDKLNRETVTTWTPTYKVSTVTYPDSSVVSNAYDSRDLLVAVKDGRGFVTSNLYDAARRRIGVIDPLTNSVTFALNENGEVTARTNATGHITHYERDALGRVTNEWDSVGGQVRENISVFDNAGRLIAVTNALDQGTQYVLDGLGRRIETIRADGESEYFVYDQAGNLLAFTNGAGEAAMQYAYDGQNRVTNEVNALGHSRSFAFDAAGNRTKRIDADGNETEYFFDGMNRIYRIEYPNSSEARFEYAPWGGLTLASNITAVVTYGHDAMNRVVSITSEVASATSVVNYGYDYNGNRTALEYPGGTDVAFQYDDANRLSGITGDLGAYGFDWDAAGRLTDIEYPNGVDAVYAHDVAGQLTNFSYAGATTFVERGITRDLLGRKSVESIEAGLEVIPPDTHQFHHSDEADRLYHVSRMDTYEYPEAWRDLRPGYSQDGNVTNIVEGYNGQSLTHTLSWDYGSRLTAYSGELSTNMWVGTPPVPGSRYFGYDARGNRVWRSVTGNTSPVHVLDHAASLANVLAESKSDGTVLRVYLWAPGVGLLAHKDVSGSGTNRYYHADELGSTLAITDGSGSVSDEFCYAPYGELIGRTGSTVTPYTFVGRYGVYWEDGPLYHMKARYYHAGLKRFLSKDPLGVRGLLARQKMANLYAYAAGNPLFWIDVLGLCEDGMAYIQGYIDGLQDAGWNLSDVLDVINDNDLRIVDPDGTYVFDGQAYQADQMGNIGPGYAVSEIYGPAASAFSMIMAEIVYNSSREGNDIETVLQDALGSFYYNGIGIGAQMNDALDETMDYVGSSQFFLDSTPP